MSERQEEGSERIDCWATALRQGGDTQYISQGKTQCLGCKVLVFTSPSERTGRMSKREGETHGEE